MARVVGIVDPVRQPADDIDTRELAVRHLGGEKVVGDEAAERGADAVLVVRHDAGMGDRNPEGMAEQRDHREPVGAGPDHPGFREGAHIGNPRPVDLGDGRRHEDDRHQHQQQQRDHAHALEVGKLCFRRLERELNAAGRFD